MSYYSFQLGRRDGERKSDCKVQKKRLATISLERPGALIQAQHQISYLDLTKYHCQYIQEVKLCIRFHIRIIRIHLVARKKWWKGLVAFDTLASIISAKTLLWPKKGKKNEPVVKKQVPDEIHSNSQKLCQIEGSSALLS